MKPCLHLRLNPVGDYPNCKYVNDWDALCTIQQRAFHGEGADPLTTVLLKQCNPKLFNQITRAWEIVCLWIMYGLAYVIGYVSAMIVFCRIESTGNQSWKQVNDKMHNPKKGLFQFSRCFLTFWKFVEIFFFFLHLFLLMLFLNCSLSRHHGLRPKCGKNIARTKLCSYNHPF